MRSGKNADETLLRQVATRAGAWIVIETLCEPLLATQTTVELDR